MSLATHHPGLSRRELLRASLALGGKGVFEQPGLGEQMPPEPHVCRSTHQQEEQATAQRKLVHRITHHVNGVSSTGGQVLAETAATAR